MNKCHDIDLLGDRDTAIAMHKIWKSGNGAVYTTG